MASPHLILASASPRRRYLLEQAGLPITVIPSTFDEGSVPFTDPVSHVRTLARGKAVEVGKRYPDSWIIGADTTVVIGDAVLGKPNSMEEARDMLRRLSGQTHQVFTGYCLCNPGTHVRHCDAVRTEVVFKRLSAAEIEWYIRTDEPFDKAGAYAIQGIGTFLVRRITGSYTNVIGLPVCEVIERLIQEGVVGFDGDNGALLQPERKATPW